MQLRELVLFEEWHQAPLVLPEHDVLSEVGQSEQLQELEEVSFLAHLLLSGLVPLQSSLAAHVTKAFLATAGAEEHKKPRAQVLRIAVPVAPLCLEALRHISFSLLMCGWFFTTLHARPRRGRVHLTDQASPKFERLVVFQ